MKEFFYHIFTMVASYTIITLPLLVAAWIADRKKKKAEEKEYLRSVANNKPIDMGPVVQHGPDAHYVCDDPVGDKKW